MNASLSLSLETISSRIVVVRNLKVMLDHDLARLYGVPTKRLNEQVARNKKRFPKDFMFKLTKKELSSLRSQNATLDTARGKGKHRKYLPYVFTEQGVAMLSSVLSSERAVRVNIAIMRTFILLRKNILGYRELSERLADLEKKYDKRFSVVFEALRYLIEPPEPARAPIGFDRG